MNPKDKIVLITGGSRGIGLEIVEQFHDAGARVISTATKKENFPSIKDEQDVIFLEVDFLSASSTWEFLYVIQGIKVDALINNAGIFYSEKLGSIDSERWDDVMKVNLTAPMLVSNTVARGMKERKQGKIINISSIAAEISKIGHSAYSASKAGLNGFTRACALDMAPYNVLVNAVCPGTTVTDMTRKEITEERRLDIRNKIPLNKLGNTTDIANLVLFLASDLNTNITGQAINIDGGYTTQ